MQPRPGKEGPVFPPRRERNVEKSSHEIKTPARQPLQQRGIAGGDRQAGERREEEDKQRRSPAAEQQGQPPRRAGTAVPEKVERPAETEQREGIAGK